MISEKANAICLLRVLNEYSDEKHILPMREIIARMKSEYGVNTGPSLVKQGNEIVLQRCLVLGVQTVLPVHAFQLVTKAICHTLRQ